MATFLVAGVHGTVKPQATILTDLLFSGTYSPDVRPNLAYQNSLGYCDAEPDQVTLQIAITEIAKMDERTQTYGFNAHLLLAWDDPRLTFNGSDCADHALVLTSSYILGAIWKPSLYFEHAVTTDDKLGAYKGNMIRVNQHGHVEWTRQAHIELHCSMGFGQVHAAFRGGWWVGGGQVGVISSG